MAIYFPSKSKSKHFQKNEKWYTSRSPIDRDSIDMLLCFKSISNELMNCWQGYLIVKNKLKFTVTQIENVVILSYLYKVCNIYYSTDKHFFHMLHWNSLKWNKHSENVVKVIQKYKYRKLRPHSPSEKHIKLIHTFQEIVLTGHRNKKYKTIFLNIQKMLPSFKIGSKIKTSDNQLI